MQKKKSYEFISWLFSCPQPHSPPTQGFSHETKRVIFVTFDSYDWSLFPFFPSPVTFQKWLSCFSNVENTPNASLSWVSVSIHIVRHPAASGDWSNSYHPTQLSGCSLPLAVALWFPTYVSMPVAFLLKGQLQNVQTLKCCYFMCFLKALHQKKVTIWRMKGTDARKIHVQNYLKVAQYCVFCPSRHTREMDVVSEWQTSRDPRYFIMSHMV